MQTENAKGDCNPLNMYQLEEGGPFVLPSQLCSARRTDFFKRGNTILGFYSAIAMTSKHGQDIITKWEKEGKLKSDTPLRLDMKPSGGIIQTNYGLFKKHVTDAGIHLTNQVFLMLYGNLEAYLSDLVLDALTQMGSMSNPLQMTLKLMITSKWQAKIDRINQKLGIGKQLGKSALLGKFKNIDMGFLGEPCQDPIEFLEKVADFRHRLVHSSGRVDKEFASTYPQAGLSIGQTLSLPFGFPIPFQLFLSHLTGVIDEAFSDKFGWKRTMVSVHNLTV